MLDADFLALDAAARNSYLKDLLENHVLQVTFTKVNGERREMPCTLKRDIIPPKPQTESKKPPLANPEVLRVFCTDKNEWRSFKVMNILDFSVVENQQNGKADR